MRQFSKIVLASLVLAGLFVQPVAAGVVVPGFAATTLAANDDGSTGLIALPFTVNFLGSSYSGLWVNNNGNVTFDGSMGTFTPFNLYIAGRVIIAPFFADVDTRGGSGLTSYGTGTYAGRTAFGVTWPGVGYYGIHTDKLNTFQLILTDRSDVGAGDFDIYFNYDQILWETGDASSGSGGLGGYSARAGYSNGLVADSYELPGSAVNGALLDGGPNSLVGHTNDGVLGQYLFQVRNGQVIPPPNGVPDGGATVALLGLGLAGLLALKRRHG